MARLVALDYLFLDSLALLVGQAGEPNGEWFVEVDHVFVAAWVLWRRHREPLDVGSHWVGHVTDDEVVVLVFEAFAHVGTLLLGIVQLIARVFVRVPVFVESSATCWFVDGPVLFLAFAAAVGDSFARVTDPEGVLSRADDVAV